MKKHINETTHSTILPSVLSINASDSTGEAGIVADIGTISALRGRPLAAMTSIISQEVGGPQHISNLPTELVLRQISSALLKGSPKAVKVGFLSDSLTIESLTSIIQAVPRKVMVPSIIDSTGNKLLSPQAIDMWIKHLFPLADLLILKVCEAEEVLGIKIHTDADMLKAAGILCEMGAKAVMLRGAEISDGYLTAVLLHQNGHRFFSSRNMDKWRRHGMAGALSTAIATRYAMGDSTEEGVLNAHSYIHSHLIYSIMPSQGMPALRSADIYNGFLSLLTEHYASAHDVAFYAGKLCVSTRYLQEVTDKMAEKTPKQIITDYLMQEACNMLKGTRLTIQQISLRLGFSSQAQFSRFFSREWGLSPQAYRFDAEQKTSDK
jgi:hydroxymethylpyrimidine/phosphomethylpyrimidine kinase